MAESDWRVKFCTQLSVSHKSMAKLIHNLVWYVSLSHAFRYRSESRANLSSYILSRNVQRLISLVYSCSKLATTLTKEKKLIRTYRQHLSDQCKLTPCSSNLWSKTMCSPAILIRRLLSHQSSAQGRGQSILNVNWAQQRISPVDNTLVEDSLPPNYSPKLFRKNLSEDQCLCANVQRNLTMRKQHIPGSNTSFACIACYQALLYDSISTYQSNWPIAELTNYSALLNAGSGLASSQALNVVRGLRIFAICACL